MKTPQAQNTSPAEKVFKIAAVLILLALTLVLLAVAVFSSTPQLRQLPGSNLGTTEKFYMNASNAISDAMPNVVLSEKKYKISGYNTIPPKPNKEAYGKLASSDELAPVLQKAEKLLDGQSLYFSTVTDIDPDFGVQYYRDDTILAVTWKKAIHDGMYTFSEIKIADASQFRRFLSGGKYGSGKLAYPTEMANTVHSVVASSGDYFEFRNAGVIVYNGTVCRVSPGADTCYVDVNGDLLFTHLHERMNMDTAKQFVEDHQIQFSLAFGPVLVENGVRNDYGAYPLGEVFDSNSRAALCQMDSLHYLLVTCNPEGNARTRPTMAVFAEQIYNTGCKMAYALDGGQTTALVMDGVLLNQIIRNHQRKISDIIYFATAIPDA